MFKCTFVPRALFLYIYHNQTDLRGMAREFIGLNPLNYTTGKYIYPPGIPVGDNYWIESGIKNFILSWMIFMASMIYRVLNNLKNG